MEFRYEDFTFKPDPSLGRARRILIKPCAYQGEPYPVSTSPDILRKIIEGIRQVSEADIVIIDSTPDGSPIRPVYKKLGYDFPGVLMLDVRDAIVIDVENPLLKPLAVSSFMVPNVIISSDYLISVAPLKVVDGLSSMSLMNLLSLLPGPKYGDGSQGGWESLYELDIVKVIVDLYFTIPFDLGVVEAKQKLITSRDGSIIGTEDIGKVFIGEPFEVDFEVFSKFNLDVPYLNIIEEARGELDP